MEIRIVLRDFETIKLLESIKSTEKLNNFPKTFKKIIIKFLKQNNFPLAISSLNSNVYSNNTLDLKIQIHSPSMIKRWNLLRKRYEKEFDLSERELILSIIHYNNKKEEECYESTD